MKRPPPAAGLLLVLPLLAVVSAGPPAAAAGPTIYTWTGAQSTVWGNNLNWNPEGVPQAGDGVSLSPGPRATITDVPDIILSALTVSGDPDEAVSITGPGTVTVAGPFAWSGGDIGVDLELAQLGVGVISPSSDPMHFGSETGQTFKIDGALAFADDPLGGAHPLLDLMFDANLVVSTTGRVAMGDRTWIRANRCCVGPTSTIVVDGGIEVDTGTTKLENVGLDLRGTVQVPDDGTVELTGGPVRVDDGATLLGGGTVVVPETSGDAFDEAHAEEPDGTVKLLDDLTLADGTTLELGDQAVLSGVGAISGVGVLRLAGPRIHAQLTVAPDVYMTTVAGTTTRLVKWDPDVPGQHGYVVPRGDFDVVTGSTLSVHGGTRLVIPDDGTVRLRAGATLTADGCCTEPGRVTVQSGGKLAIGASTGDPAVLKWVELGGNGAITHVGKSEWDLAGTTFTTGATFLGAGQITGDLPAGALKVTPVGVFVVDGDYTANAGGTLVARVPTALNATATSRLFVTGTAHLAGRLETAGTTRFPEGKALLALSAGQLTGRFACSATPGWLPRQAATTLHLVAIGARDPGCLVPSARRVLRATWSGQRTAPVVVPAGADRVLLQVTISRATRNVRLMLSGGTSPRASLGAQAGRTATYHVVIGLNAARKLTARLDHRARVVINQVGWY
ncbi:hypothetical protein [Nocardioides szechwanensis]|uniref:hypothetical protein n=1 Tax=Nocardioides szechwanensis TaxID=1005944 RepID=UPI000B82FD74|nr:hypothetical protein [Nocardioides szechwanensis]